jgi:hypothetical protein
MAVSVAQRAVAVAHSNHTAVAARCTIKLARDCVLARKRQVRVIQCCVCWFRWSQSLT